MVRVIQNVGQDIVQDLFDLLERATGPHAFGPMELKRRARLLPPGFLPLVFAGFLSIAAAGVHERVRQRGSGAPRQRTHLHTATIAYASRNRMPRP